ncbi:uncharacterized protein [Apostichopus japonicus]|uniref:uncharacterized protein n=1 Tax=Stichopus japonicus TaxID=307972 RepID=UPI003AB1F47C
MMATNSKNVEETAKEKNSTDLNFGKEDLGSNSDFTSLGLSSLSSEDQDHIILENGDRLPVSSTSEELQIKANKEKEFSQDEIVGIFTFAVKCKQLKKLSFIDCLLPLSLPVGSLSQKLRDIEDSTKGKWILNSNEATTLEVPTKDQNSLRSLCSSIVSVRRIDSKELQMSTILLLEIASSHNIPIFSVYLQFCSPRVDESGLNLILQSGLSLSILSSLQQLLIIDPIGRLTNEQLAAILSYSSQCTSLKELTFARYDLPDTIPVGLIPSSLKSRNLKVWNLRTRLSYRRLNLHTGRWQACDAGGHLPGEEGFDEDRYHSFLISLE